MATLMNFMIASTIDTGKYAGRPLEAKYTFIKEFVTPGELTVIEHVTKLVNAMADDDSGDQQAWDDLWTELAHLIEYAAMAIQMQDDEDKDLLERTRAHILQDLWACVRRVISEDEINTLLASAT